MPIVPTYSGLFPQVNLCVDLFLNLYGKARPAE